MHLTLKNFPLSQHVRVSKESVTYQDSCLDLRHDWSPLADASTLERGGASAAHEAHDQRSNKGKERKPKECGAGLQLVATLGRVVRSVGQAVAAHVTLERHESVHVRKESVEKVNYIVAT